MPFVLKAGESIIVEAQANLDPQGEALNILQKLKARGSSSMEDYEKALTDANVNINGKPVFYHPPPKSDKFYSFGAGMSGGEQLGIFDVFRYKGQGIIVYIKTGRGNEINSSFYEIYLPDQGGF